MADQTPMPDAFQQATINQLTGLLKLLLMSLGTYLVQKGFLDAQSMPEIVTGVATLLVTIGWMLYARRANGILKAASNVLDGKGAIIAPQAMADKNVVPSVEAASRVPGITQG
jgi:hypothetical protein